jgi:hypothetical protein
MERQIAEQKRILAEALRMKPPSEADLLQKICRELAAEAAARNPGSSQRNVPGPAEHTRSSVPQSAAQSQPSQDQRTNASGRVETLPDHGLPPPFYRNWSSNARGDLSGGTYRPRTDGGPQQPRPPPDPSTTDQQTTSTSAPPTASATAGETAYRAFGLPSSSDFRHPSTEYAGLAPGSQQYSPPGGTNFREEDYRTSEQRPLFKPERHTFDATPKTEPWTTFRASFDAAVGSRRMPALRNF